MKKTYIKILVALLLPLFYYAVFTGFSTKGESSINSEHNILPPGPSSQKDFVNYILNCDYDFSSDKHMENFWGYYRDDLNFNGVHLYDNDTGTKALGWFSKGIEGYQQTHMENLITGAHNENLKAIYERSNISNLCYAQRLVYEVASGSGHNDVNDGFCYQNISGVYETEPDGTTAIHACVNPMECNNQNWDVVPQYICSNIYENLQHTDLPNFRPHKRDLWEWHLKPRMKIKQSDFEDPNKLILPVVSIISISFDGTPFDTITIRVRNFRDQNDEYEGLYVDIFNFVNEVPAVDLWISGDETNGLNKGRNNNWWNWDNPNSPERCRVDFKIYWHGLVDVWIDKLTVDDYRANKMFSTINNYDEDMERELTLFGNTMDIFFVDELVYSQIPCAKYVVDKIRATHPNVKISLAATNFLNILSQKNDNLGFRPLIERVKPDYFQLDIHRFFGWRESGTGNYHDNFYPDNITASDSKVPDGYTPDGWKANYSTYNNWLQNFIFGDKTTHTDQTGSFIYQLRLARDNINQYSPNTQLITQPQIHSHLFDYDAGGIGKYDEGVREPLNEEYSIQAMVSIAHGSDGLCWFWFPGISWRENNAPVNGMPRLEMVKNSIMPNTNYIHGLINEDTTRRIQNMWGQNKWQGVSEVNGKILSWKPVLDNTTWVSGWSVHSEGAGHEYISDLQSININNNTQDASNESYWEMGFYDPFLDGNFTKYFILCNRRCVPDFPVGSGNGDFRRLKNKIQRFAINDFCELVCRRCNYRRECLYLSEVINCLL